MQIKGVRFSMGLLRGPTEEEDRMVETGFSARLLLTREEALALRVGVLVGYNPQKLLPSPETIRPLTTREWADWVMGDAWIDFHAADRFPSINFRDLHEPIPVLPPGEEIHLRRLAPFVSPTGRASVPTTQRPRWNEPDATPLEDIKSLIANFDVPVQHKIAVIPIGIDFGAAEARMLAAMMGDKRVRGIVLDFETGQDYEMRRLFPISDDIFTRKPVAAPKEVSTSSGKRDMSYLKHDRTKQHRRRRR